MKLGEVLIEKGLLTKERLELALAHQKITDSMLGETLIKLGFVSSAEIARTLADQTGIPFIDLTEYNVAEDAIRLVPKDLAEKTGFIPLRLVDGSIEIGITNPSNIQAIDTASKVTGLKPRIFMIDNMGFYETLERAYFFLENPIQQNILAAIKEIKSSPAIPAATVAELAQNLIMEGIRRKTTDVHLSPASDTINIFYRVDGVLQYGFCIPKIAHAGIVSRIKVMSMLDISEQRLPQDGSFSMAFLNTKYEMRVSTTPTIYGENIVIRVLAGTGQLLRIESLGFDHGNTKQLRTLFQKPYGIILITGPTGSGKTTTLYAALREVNLIERNVLTVEDPVEYKLSFVKQTAVNLKAGYDFALAGRNFMRQDPDVMLLGEIRDEETARIGVRASITGHLVLSTLHTNDAVTSIPRLLDFKIDRFLLSSSLLAVVAQRLVRKLCNNCREEYAVSAEELKLLNVSGDINIYGHDVSLKTAYKAKGCTMCSNTGYMGRTVVGEIMVVNDEIREFIALGASLMKIKEAALKNGMVPLKIAGIQKIKQNITSIEEIVRLID
ncbi:MAG: Flp pilus assembly complex ATPase component TadA [Nitrospirae bacterium]|nr:Flp pilus assembly complex ATPase component TadA [Nitrospirota bacterium]